jgi:hypothetical protein
VQTTVMKRFSVFSIRGTKGGTVWVRAGTGFLNRDGSVNVILDVLPLDGRLHIREASDKRDAPTLPAVSDGVHAAPPMAEMGMMP